MGNGSTRPFQTFESNNAHSSFITLSHYIRVRRVDRVAILLQKMEKIGQKSALKRGPEGNPEISLGTLNQVNLKSTDFF